MKIHQITEIEMIPRAAQGGDGISSLDVFKKCEEVVLRDMV